MSNAAIWNRLAKNGLRPAAEAYKEEVRLRLRAEGADKDEANAKAENVMWDLFRKLCDDLEREKEDAKAKIEKAAQKAREAAQFTPEPIAPQLQGLPANLDSLIDPDYHEPNSGKQLRDGLLWTVMQWMYVIRDTAAGPVATIESAKVKPPNGFALLVTSTYALSDTDKRRELITRALTFAEKDHVEPAKTDATTDPQPEPTEGFLDLLAVG